MTVVADTSVILNLCFVRLERLLPELYQTVLAPPEVSEEFRHLASTDRRFSGLVFPACVQIVSPLFIPRLPVPSQRLQKGELAALALGLEQGCDAVLMDERAGRSMAVMLGLRPLGLLGILLDAKQSNLIPAIAPLLDVLEQSACFWISPDLRLHVLRLAAEE